MDIKQFKTMYELKIGSQVKKKNGLSYLSWASAWKVVLEHDPDATYSFERSPLGLPFFGEGSQSMVCVVITAFGKTQEQWLPILDHINKSIANPDSFAINKAHQRCLAKGIATICGVGLKLYEGEDIPEDDSASDEEVSIFENICNTCSKEEARIALKEMTDPARRKVMSNIKYYTDLMEKRAESVNLTKEEE